MWLQGLVPKRRAPPPWLPIKVKQGPLSHGLVSVISSSRRAARNLWPSEGATEAVSGASPVPLSVGANGVALLTGATSVNEYSSWLNKQTNGYTVFAFVDLPSSFAANPIIASSVNKPGGGTQQFQLRFNTSARGEFLYFPSGGSSAGVKVIDTGVALSASQKGVTICGKIATTGTDAFKGCVRTCAGAAITAPVLGATSTTLQNLGAGDNNLTLGAYYDGVVASAWNAPIYEVLVWDRFLTHEEENLLHRDPYAWAEPDMDGVWFAGPSGATLDIFKRRHLAHVRR